MLLLGPVHPLCPNFPPILEIYCYYVTEMGRWTHSGMTGSCCVTSSADEVRDDEVRDDECRAEIVGDPAAAVFVLLRQPVQCRQNVFVIQVVRWPQHWVA